MSRESTLAGTLAMPRFGSGPYPAVLVAHGSGCTTRKALRGYVSKLVPEGFAVLIHDKRGTGGSGGTLTGGGLAGIGATLALQASDLALWVALLREHDDIDPTRIALVGGSMAGWSMPLVGAEDPGIAFIAALNGPTVTLGEEDTYGKLTGDDAGGFAPGDLTEAEIHRRLEAYAGPDWHDPEPALRAMGAPSLWIFGGLDRSVPTSLCRERLDALPEPARANMEVVPFPEADHDMRRPNGSRVDFWPLLIRWLKIQVGSE